MKRMSATFAAIAMGTVCGGVALAADVLVIGQPGYYGRVDIVGAPKPVLVAPNPIIIERERVVNEPTYLYVPADQRNDWANYCGKYEACGRPVYFVEERWYNDVYVPHYKSKHELKKEAKAELKDDKIEAQRDYKDAKEEAKRDYKDAKREAKDVD